VLGGPEVVRVCVSQQQQQQQHTLITSLNGVKAIFSSRRRNSASQSRSDASVLFTGTIQDIGKL
jgi:hypothetical protein